MSKKIGYILIVAMSWVGLAQAQEVLPSFAPLVEKTHKSVVNISTQNLETESDDADNDVEFIVHNPKLQRYFSPKKSKTTSLGSGFLVSEDGYIVTNAHVVENAKKIDVTFADRKQVEAELVGIDRKTDLAMLKVSVANKLPAAKLGNSDDLRVGDWVLAIGNPFGLGGSVSAGIVSAMSRDIASGAYDDFIQTDASINQGSSGGPMFNLKGEVVGINSAIYSTSGASVGIGFATPINLAKFVIEELKTKGKVERGWLGIKVQETEKGIVISTIMENSPAQKAGIEVGDILLAIDGVQIENPRTFARSVAEQHCGEVLTVEVLRNRVKQIRKLTVEPLPNFPPLSTTTKETEKQASFEVSNIDDTMRERYGLADDVIGVIVTSIGVNNDAVAKGLKEGDLITEVDKKQILTSDDFWSAVGEANRENGRPVELRIDNNGTPNFATVKL